jgi:lipopolysaccharide heptosyltransferase II
MTKPDPARLVVVAPNWLGDAVMALAALADIREEFPRAVLAVAARRAVAPLYQMVAGVDEVVELSSPGGLKGSAARVDADRLRAGRFDVAILFPNSLAAALMVSRAAIPERWGYRSDWRSRWLTRRVPRPRGGHQIAYYRDLVRAFGVGPARDPLEIVVRAEAKAAAREQLTSLGWDGHARLVGVAPAAAYGTAKQWPPEYFAALVSDLRARDRTAIVLVGTASDRRAGSQVVRALDEGHDASAGGSRSDEPRPAIVNLIGETDLPQLAAVLSWCAAFVSNDSGAMHLAAALGVPVTAVFGPTDDRETAPRGRREGPPPRVLVHDVWCRPCMLRECPIDHRCMRGLEPPRVADACRSAWTA